VGLEELLIPDDAAADLNRFFSYEAETAKFLLRQLKLSHEARVNTLLFAGSTPFTTADQSAAVPTPKAHRHFDVARDVAAAKLALAKLGYEANCVAMNADVFALIRRSPKLQNQFFGVISNTGARLLSEAEIAAALGSSESSSWVRRQSTTAGKNKSYSGSFAISSAKVIVGQVAGGEFTAGGIGRTLVWSGDSAGGFVSESYRDEARRSQVLRVRMNTDEVVIDANAAVRITTSFA
jgi:hypothetical protein